MFDMIKIGEKIFRLRKKYGITQNNLADSLGISTQAVSNWERGTTMPDISKLRQLAEILNTSVDYILDDMCDNDVISNDGNYGNNITSDYDIAKSAYDSGDINMFSELVEILDQKTLSKIFTTAYKDGKYEFVAEMVDFVPQKDIKNCALYAYDNNDLHVFAEITDSLSPQNKQLLKQKAISDKRSDFLSELFA